MMPELLTLTGDDSSFSLPAGAGLRCLLLVVSPLLAGAGLRCLLLVSSLPQEQE